MSYITIAFAKPGSWIGQLIAITTGFKYSHVVLVSPDGEFFIESSGAGPKSGVAVHAIGHKPFPLHAFRRRTEKDDGIAAGHQLLAGAEDLGSNGQASLPTLIHELEVQVGHHQGGCGQDRLGPPGEHLHGALVVGDGFGRPVTPERPGEVDHTRVRA